MTESSDQRPGYRRRIRIEPRGDGQAGAVLAMLEDDMHCMAVTLRHAEAPGGRMVTGIEPVMERAPWTTCPGARAKLVETFAGQPLEAVTARRDKRANCTHLHDLATLAAAHAGDRQALTYDVAVSDPVAGERLLELRRDGRSVLRWREQDGLLVAPESAAGLPLMGLRDWIASLPPDMQEPARVLQWAGLVAHGRTIPLAEQSRAADLPPNCWSFQPERAVHAERVGEVRDFNGDPGAPLGGFAERQRALAFGD